ncbi:hypothetical protein SAMN05421788_105156 [Filimonas lacunae]|uniref:Serine aminopeptidase S33 domain-containing protein n=1 Tax=Filimonas lacunae TaxID=477680 RepID=A0A173MCZ2_9BACT|nr:alpha/beta hydrolase [Filimonas lacunae]BAV05390.1 hypothetical protein FLA_1397 [Filimonas lacunae]SIT21523.1 hypothetical protein SAMN05421788_105156 [Filimonas lacunae]
MRRIYIALAMVLFGGIGVSQAQLTKYKEDSVRFANGDKSVSFGGTLSLPVTGKPCAAVVILSGTGPQNQDGDMGGHKMFSTIAHYLGERGIAVLRVDDRGVGSTTGEYATATTGDFAADALAAVAYLKTRKEIDAVKIGLMGHSEGGAAMCIAAAQSSDVHFLVGLAGLAMGGYDSQIKQNEDIVNGSALPDYDKKRSNEIDSLMFRTALQYADSANMEAKLLETYFTWKHKDSIYFESLHIEFDHFRFPYYSYIAKAIGPWYRYFISYNAAKVMAQVKVPVLALNGDKDILVACKENLENWKQYIAAGGNHDVTTVVIPGVNHLFLACQKCDLYEYPQLKTEFSPMALDTIVSWIQQKF